MEAILKDIISQLSESERALLKCTINQGGWGSADYEFLTESGDIETVGMYGYCTNNIIVDGLTRKQLPAIYKSIYKKLCNPNGIGRYISHCSDWWGDGNGDMLFIREDLDELFRKWSKEPETSGTFSEPITKKIEFPVKTLEGKEFKVYASNLTEAEDGLIEEIGCSDGDYLEILGETKIHRITRQEGAQHWKHPGFIFDSFDMIEGLKRGISLFKIR